MRLKVKRVALHLKSRVRLWLQLLLVLRGYRLCAQAADHRILKLEVFIIMASNSGVLILLVVVVLVDNDAALDSFVII